MDRLKAYMSKTEIFYTQAMAWLLIL